MIVFEDRNSNAKLLPPTPVKLRRYSRIAVGGPKTAELETSGDLTEVLAWLNWLRRKIYIANASGKTVWWGFISKVEISFGGLRVTADIESMYNRIAVAYTTVGSGQSSVGLRGTTDWTEDADSISEFGRRELLKSMGGTTATVATVNRDKELREKNRPEAVWEPTSYSEPTPRAIITCSGWWSTLSWRYAPVATNLALAFETIGTLERTIGETNADAWAQSFVPVSNINLQEIAVYIKKTGNPTDNIKLSVHENPDDLTPGDQLTSVSINGALVGTGYGWVKGTLSSPYALTNGTRYFLVVDRSGSDSPADYYTIKLDELQGYGGGILRMKEGATWGEAPKADMPFRLYDNTLVETTQQIASFLTNFGQFLRKVDVENQSGVSSESYRNGDSDAQYEVEELLATGTNNYRRLLADVDSDRNVRVWEQPDRTNRPYLVDNSGAFRDPEGHLIDSSECPAGMWALPREITKTAAVSGVNLQAFFVEETEYDAVTGKLTFRPYNALDKWDFGTREG
jgi:hypothetical protein